MGVGDTVKRYLRNTAVALGTSFFVATCGAPLSAVQLAGVGVYATAVMDVVTYGSNLIPRDEETAVFVSSYDNSGFVPEWMPRPVVAGAENFFMYAPVTLRENIEGRNTTWHTDLNKEEVLETIADTTYQSFVFIGHGGKGSFCPSFYCVDDTDIAEMNTPRRSGEVVQYTCRNTLEGDTIADVLLEDPDKLIKFDEEVWPLRIYGRALWELGRSMNPFGDD